MKRNTVTIGLATAVLAVFSIFSGVWVSAQDGIGKEDASKFAAGNGSKSLEGAWTVAVTLRNCQTGAAIRTFPRMITFMQGGTMQEFAAAGPPTLRGPGQGVWNFLYDGKFTYALHFLRFGADGTLAGSVVERRSLEVDGDTYNATGTAEVFDANGNVIVTTCATEEGTRFQ